MKELKVGERVTITLEAVKQEGCKGCFFVNLGICLITSCRISERSDRKHVIFKEVKEQSVWH